MNPLHPSDLSPSAAPISANCWPGGCSDSGLRSTHKILRCMEKVRCTLRSRQAVMQP